MTPLKIMALDDDISYLTALKDLLSGPERDVHICSQPGDSWAMLRTLKPDCLILDLQMPFMDGREMVLFVQKECPGIVIIICSGKDAASDPFLKASGVKHILKKPVSSAVLLQTVQAAVSERKAAA